MHPTGWLLKRRKRSDKFYNSIRTGRIGELDNIIIVYIVALSIVVTFQTF